jgi:hypothetical protein
MLTMLSPRRYCSIFLLLWLALLLLFAGSFSNAVAADFAEL